MIYIHKKLNWLFGFLAAEIMLLFGKSSTGSTVDDLKKAEFKTSTQKMGVAFTERIRNTFRFKWLRKI